MMKVKLKRDTSVRFSAGTVLEVSDQEASRLVAFGNAELVEEKPKEPETKRSTKKRSE